MHHHQSNVKRNYFPIIPFLVSTSTHGSSPSEKECYAERFLIQPKVMISIGLMDLSLILTGRGASGLQSKAGGAISLSLHLSQKPSISPSVCLLFLNLCLSLFGHLSYLLPFHFFSLYPYLSPSIWSNTFKDSQTNSQTDSLLSMMPVCSLWGACKYLLALSPFFCFLLFLFLSFILSQSFSVSPSMPSSKEHCKYLVS